MATVFRLESDGEGNFGLFSTRELADAANAIVGGVGWVEEVTLDVMPEPTPSRLLTQEELDEINARNVEALRFAKRFEITWDDLTTDRLPELLAAAGVYVRLDGKPLSE